MSTAAIRAGKAFYEILADDKTSKGLNSADARLKRFGASVLVVGASISAAASAGLGMFGVAVAKFVSFGSEINDFAERTGASTDWAQAWKAAAELVGGSLSDVEASIRKLQKSGKFEGMSPEQAFAAAADEINSIEDPMAKRAKALELFGKSGTKILPMLAGMREQMEAMQKNGLLLSPEQIKTADDLGDAWDTLKNTFGAAVRLIGSALAPDLLKLVGYMTQGAIAAAQFVANNQGLFKALAFGLVILGGIGAALTVVGGAIAAAGFALSGFAAVWAALPVILPIVGAALAYVATVAATMYAVFTLFPGLLTFLSDSFQTFGAIAAQTFSGIFNAIVQGNWALAGKIAMQGLMLAFQTGWSWLKIGWAETMNWLYGRMVDIFGSRIIGFIARTMKSIVEIINAGLAVFGYEGIETGGLDKMIAAANNGDDALKRIGDAKVQATRDQAAKDIAAEQAKLDALNAQAALKQESKMMAVAKQAYTPGGVAAALAATKSEGFANSSAAARFAQFSPQFDPSEKLDEQIDVLKEVRDAVKANAVEFAD